MKCQGCQKLQRERAKEGENIFTRHCFVDRQHHELLRKKILFGGAKKRIALALSPLICPTSHYPLSAWEKKGRSINRVEGEL